MKTVLAPVDFSSVTNRVTDAAVTLARLLKGRVVLLHVVPPPAAIRDVLPAMEDVELRTMSTTNAATRNLEQLKHDFQRKFHPMDILVLTGPPVAGIVEQAQKLAADYIVVGSHGHSAIYDTFVGSVAGGVVKKAPCPVLIIPPMPVSPMPRTEAARQAAGV